MLKNSSLFIVGLCFYVVILMGGCGASQSTAPAETISENSSSVSNDLDSENTSTNQSTESNDLDSENTSARYSEFKGKL